METLPAETPLDSKWHEIWLDIWAHPGDQAFRDILKERNHSASRAFIWVAVTSLLLAIITTIGYIPLYRNLVSQFNSLSNSNIIGNTSIITVGICSLILTPIFAVIGLGISSGIYHLISKIFGGNGNWSDLIFCMGAVSAPASLLSAVLFIPYLLFGNFPAIWWLVAILIGILTVVLAVYVLIMNVNALRAAENIGTGGAVGTLLVPIAIGLVLSVCCISLTIPSLINSVR